MGHGTDPAPLNELGVPVVIDAGTLARTGSPTPAPVGLDSGGGPSKMPPSIPHQLITFARQRIGKRHRDGECFTLADDALKNAGAKSAADFGKITPNADYVWGTSISQAGVKSGDLIQFRNYRYDKRVETKNSDGSGSFTTEFQERPHHTAIVEDVHGDGSITVLEQNAPEGTPGARMTLYFSNGSSQSGNTTTTVKVKGSVRFYRAQAR